MKPTVILLACAVAFATADEKTNRTSYQQSQSPRTTQTKVTATLLNINRMSAWYESNGKMEQNPFNGNSGVTYPRETSTAIFASGILWGGLVKDGITPTLRVNGQAYSVGTVAGAIKGIRTGEVEDNNGDDVRIWRIRRDFVTADLQQDAAEFFVKAFASVDTNDINAVREQYKKDWKEWPAHKGAPFYDADGDGKYIPKFEMKNGKEIPVLYPQADEPGLQDADQVIWFVCNDIAGSSPWASPDIGLEEQVTLWGYKKPSNDALGNAIFKRFKLIYKGTSATPADAIIDSFYIGHWSDPDLGDYSDDYTGCDSVLGVGYVYNSKTLDKEYQKFNLSAPAVGYILLQGPIVKDTEQKNGIFDFGWRKGYSNVPLTSFEYFTSGGLWGNCDWHCDWRSFWYNALRGYEPRFSSVTEILKNPVTGIPTRFWLHGDPISKTGWIDGLVEPPGDKKILMSSGPFTMAVGDTQEVIYALVGGLGSDRIASYQVMKFNMKKVRETFLLGMVSDPTSVRSNDGNIPKEFSLSQNYPNPFNPSTIINYQIPTNSFVALKVFDMLGREIATLVNEEKEAGSYNIEFRMTNYELPSGVYFYQLRAGNFVESKKMVRIN